jgi:hypothetical protein
MSDPITNNNRYIRLVNTLYLQSVAYDFGNLSADQKYGA